MVRSSEEGSRRRRGSRSTKSEAAEARMASSEKETRRRTRRTKSEAAEAKVASSEEETRRRTRRTKSEAAEAKVASSEEETRGRTRRTKSGAAEAKMASSPSSQDERILNLESEEDREILMKVKSEEGKILKLKKEYLAANQAGLLPPLVPAAKAARPAVKKTKKVLVKRLMTITKAQIDFTKAMAARPSPSPILTEYQLAQHTKSFQYTYHQDHRIRNTRLAYFLALVDQQERFGFAVDESEAEVTDDEGDDMVVNLVVN